MEGLVYIALAGNWKLDLAREIKAAGITVDLNLVGWRASDR